MAKTKINLAENEVSFEIDLEKFLGGSASSETVRETFFQAIYDQMIERLDEGKDFKGRSMSKYSKSYKDSLPYVAFNKDGTVNMTLTGDMISSISILEQDAKKMVIGFKGDENNAKAFAHITGFKGHPTLDGKVKPREFFGWTEKALSEIADKIKPQSDQQLVSDEKLLGLLNRLLG